MDNTKEVTSAKTKPKSEKDTIKFITNKKKEMKESQYRKMFDNLVKEIKQNLVNTQVSYGDKKYEANSGFDSQVFYNRQANGSYDINVYPVKNKGFGQNISGVPTSQEPIAFSKILIATSVLGAKIPDATVCSDSEVYSRLAYELWKNTWKDTRANGNNTIVTSYQNSFTYGWAAWRVFPRSVRVKRKGVDKIIFDDVYREPLNPERTWLGVGFNNYDFFSRGEVYYEKDMTRDDFFIMYPEAEKNKKLLDYCAVSDESKQENNERQFTHVTIGYYENVLSNRYIVTCGKMVIYDGELPNDDSFGSVIVTRCFVRNMEDPHGVGLYELMRGNTALYTYLNTLNAQQVEAEISPLIFGSQVQNGTGTYRRGPNIVNPKHPGTDLEVVRTTGNVSQGIGFADKQKQNIEDNTGVNNIVAGQGGESTVGATVILKEAALNRLIVPRNNMIEGLALDALICHSWQKMLYPVDKVFMVADEGLVEEFMSQNPDFFVQYQPIEDGTAFKGFAVAASPNIRLNFDFTAEGKIIENTSPKKISARDTFEKVESYGHRSSYINFVIDANSMLLPSEEIQKQTYMALFPLITTQITNIFAMRMQDPEASKSQLMALEQMLNEQKLDIYEYISKDIYDQIIQLAPSISQMQMRQVNASLPAPDGSTPGGDNGSGGIPGQGMDPMGPMQSQAMQRPQSTLGASVDASLGRAKEYSQ